MPTILDSDGNPLTIPRKALAGDVAAPSPWNAMGWRTVWHRTLARGLSPARLAQILDAADAGNPHDFLTFAQDLEERDPHYASVLGTRKRALLGLERKVESASDKLRDRKIADAVRLLIDAPIFGHLLNGMLDALGKGYSAVEIEWDTRAAPWLPVRYHWRDPRWFLLDKTDGETLRLIDAADPVLGIPLPPARFIVHQPRLKMGLSNRGGLARLVAISSFAKQIVLESWLSFSESYGSPTRIAKADDRFFLPGAGTDAAAFVADLQTKLQAMLGQDAYAVFPKSVDTVLQQATMGGAEVFHQLSDYLNKLISKAVLGRSDAADSTSGSLGGKQEAQEVRQDILESDAEQLQNTVNDQLVTMFVELNFGTGVEVPQFKFHFPTIEDLSLLVTALEKLVPLGLKVEQSVVRDKLNIPDPDAGVDLLSVPKTPPNAPPSAVKIGQVSNPESPPPALNIALQRHDVRHPATGQFIPAADPTADPTAPILDRLGREGAPLIEGMLDPVRAALDASASLDDFRAKLLLLYPKMDAKAFAALLGSSLALAEAQGYFEAKD
jgi:phage gp29-like protein